MPPPDNDERFVDPACGPYRHWIEDQAEQDRKARFISDEEMSCFAHERSWESDAIRRIAAGGGSVDEQLVKAFYTGRASANRERPHARRMVSDALNACHIRYQRAAAQAFSQIMHTWGRD